MSIISLTFILFIIIVICAYFLLPGRFQWIILLIASLAFYVSNGWQSLLYILVTILTQYFLAAALDNKNASMTKEMSEEGIDGRQKKEIKKKYASIKKKYVAASIIINIGLLCYVKYSNFMIDNINAVLRAANTSQLNKIDILVPLGISFYTFKSIGYVIDVYRGKVKAERNIFKLALFVSYFPAIIQGPIDRYADSAHQFYETHKFDYTRVMFGAQRMLWGYIKKLVIAERAAVIVNEVLNNYDIKNYYGLIILIAAMLYAFQIYADFSGGMDIVLGLSEIFGIKLTENFRQPYLAGSVAEFWQRWHITLGAWMRTYVFYPLSLSPAFNKLGKACRKRFGEKLGKVIAPSLASFMVFVLVGVWHGADWKFVIYGIYQAIFVSSATLFEDFYAKMRLLFKIHTERFTWKIFTIIRTFLILTIGRYFSIASSTRHAFELLKATFSGFNPWIFFDDTLYNLGLNRKNFSFMLFSIAVLIAVDICQDKGIKIREHIAKQNIVLRWAIYYIAIFTLIIFGMYGPGYNAASFIYQQF